MGRKEPNRKQGEEPKQFRWGFRGKTVWDWLPIVGALLVPLAVALGTGWITWQLAENENQRAEAERALAEQRAQDEALQAYLTQMGTLLLEKDLRYSTEDNATEDSKEARTLARARTLTVLGRLDPSRKTAVMEFLLEAELVQGVNEGDPIISVADADVSDANLRGANLRGANLSDANLSNANLRGADLSDLSDANLSNANLSGADLSDADLNEANLNEADLSEANLRGADLTNADLRTADLRGADLSRADLSRADLSSAYLINADLRGADLLRANLSDAIGITEERLEEQAFYIDGATMPNGQKYEDWLKSKD